MGGTEEDRPAGIARRHVLLAAAALLAGCTARPRPTAVGTTSRGTPTARVTSPATTTSAPPVPAPVPVPGTPAEILARSTVPVLCWHQLREHRPDDSAYARSMITPRAVLTAQLRALHDAGYTTVTAPALTDHLQYGTGLPERPVLLTFDDGSETHWTVGLPALQQAGFVATFFPMTVVLDKPNWLSRDQVRALDRAGMTIGAHTWDHQRLDRLPGDQWGRELVEPAATLAEILGRPVDLLAYPYGVWSQETLTRVAAAGYRAAFQLAEAQDPAHPLLTIRRIMPPPTWDGPALLAHLGADFPPGQGTARR